MQLDAQPSSARQRSRSLSRTSSSSQSLAATLSAASPRAAAAVRSSIPLDPRAESEALAEAYRQSRLQRLLAVRQASDAQAAQRREAYRAAQQREAEQQVAQRAAQAAQAAAEAQRALATQLEVAQMQLGEAQRAAAAHSLQQQLAAEQLQLRRQAQEAQAAQRFERALTLVQQRAVHERAARAQRAALKEAGRAGEKQVRAQIEEAKKRQARRTPAHLIEYNKAAAAGVATPSHAPAESSHPSPLQVQMHVSGRSHFSPAHLSVASRSDSGCSSDTEEAPAPLPLPTPHPHPSQPRSSGPHHQQQQHRTPRTPSISVALDFTSPAAPPTSAPVQPLPAARASDFGQPYSQRRRSQASKAAPSAPLSHPLERSFELVEKRDGQVVCQTIDAAAALSADDCTAPAAAADAKDNKRHPSATHKRNSSKSRPTAMPRTQPMRSKQKSKANAKAKKRASVPVLVPNAAFFAQQAQAQARQASSDATSLFHPLVECSSGSAQKAQAWVIPLSGDLEVQEEEFVASQSAAVTVQAPCQVQVCVNGGAVVQAPSQVEAPPQRGLELLAAHKERQKRAVAANASAQDDTQAVAPTPLEAASAAIPAAIVGMEIGQRFYAQSDDAYATAVAAFAGASSMVVAEAAPASPTAPAPSTPRSGPASSETGAVFSSPLFPLASAAAARVAALQRTAATPLRADFEEDEDTEGAAPSSALSSNALDKQLHSILQHHLHRDAAATQLLFSPHMPPPPSTNRRAAAQTDSGDSEDEEEQEVRTARMDGEARFASPLSSGAATVAAPTSASSVHGAGSMWATPRSGPLPPHTPLAWSSAAPASAGTPILSCPTSPLSPAAALMVCSPSAATDLFIEEIHYALERERAQAAEVEAQLQEHRSPAPVGVKAATTPMLHADEGRAQVQMQTPMLQQHQSQQSDSTHPSAAPYASTAPTPSHPAAPTGQWASPTAFLHVPQTQAPKSAFDAPASGMVTPAKQTALRHAASPLPVPQSADRAALLSAFSALSSDDLMAVKPLRSANASGASSLFQATPAHSHAQPQFSGPFATPLRTPNAAYAYAPASDREPMRQPHFQNIAL